MTRKYSTAEYEINHGRKPRGLGDWGFIPSDHIRNGKIPAEAIAWSWDNYADAKREVAKRHPEITEWTVLP
jgi:hypothetical protein